MPYIETPDGIPIYYIDEGRRTNNAIFLIHGEPFNTNCWEHNIPTLSEQFRVVAIDVRGRGNSGKTTEGHNFAQYARDFNHILSELNLDQILVVGWSMGGAVVWEYIKQYGEQLLAGFINVDQRPYRYVSEEDYNQKMNQLKTNRLQTHKQIIAEYLGPEFLETTGEYINHMSYDCMKTPTDAHISLMTDSYYSDYRSFLVNITVPSLIFGAKYGFIDGDLADQMRKSMQNCRLVWFDHSGHLMPWTEADKFNKEVADFGRHVLST